MRGSGRLSQAPSVLVGVAAAGSVALLLAWLRNRTFWLDEWDLLLYRRDLSFDAILSPHNEHIIVAPALIYNAIQAALGMESLLPYAVASIAAFIASIVLLFEFVRRRLGGWLALGSALLILFMGAAYEDLLFPFQVGYFGSMACGLGALLALERRDGAGDALACGLLVGSLAFSSLGLPFTLGAAVALWIGRGSVQRAYVFALPLLLYALWYAGWGHMAGNSVSFRNLANSPSYVLDGLAASVSSLLGLTTPPFFDSDGTSNGGLAWGRPLLVALLFAMGLRLRSLGRVPPWLWVTGAILLSFWFLTALNSLLGRPPNASRYQYVGGVFLILVMAELLRGVRLGRPALAGVLALCLAAAAGNLSTLRDASTALVNTSAVIKGSLAGLEISTDSVDPDFTLNQENSGIEFFDYVRAEPYLSAVEDHGSPAYTQSELTEAPEPARIAADKVLAAALPVGFAPESFAAEAGPAPQLLAPRGAFVSASRGCIVVRPGAADAPTIVTLPPGGALLQPDRRGQTDLQLRRFAAEGFSVPIGKLRTQSRLEVPEDRSFAPWQLALSGAASGHVTACGIEPG
jgi:hypothetical protein